MKDGNSPALRKAQRFFCGDTYRVVYAAKFEEAVYVFDAFQKKSPRGKQLPKHLRERLVQRYQYIKEHRVPHGVSRSSSSAVMPEWGG